MSYIRRKPEDELWYVHAPLKKGNRQLVMAPPPSQIPFLNGVFEDEERTNQPRTIYTRDTDTDFIRRCKLGITGNFLVHIDPAARKSKEPVAYGRPIWWDAMCEPILQTDNTDDSQKIMKNKKIEHVFGAPEWFIHREHNPSVINQSKQP